MDDPDIYEMDDYRGIEVFEPGTEIEREVSGDKLFRILLLTGLGFALTFGITVVLEVPLLLLGYITIYGNQIQFAPYVFMLLTVAEFGFIIPPLWYIRKHGYGLGSIGIKIPKPLFGNIKSKFSELPKDIIFGLIFGVMMLASNIAITWFMTLGIETSGGDDASYLFASHDIIELLAWIFVMFVVVGFTEELLFRGFLQRRMEIFFRDRYGSYKIIALAITSFIFAIMHLDLLGLAARFVLGLFMGYLAQRRQYSIIGPTVAHGFNNAAVVVFAFLGF
ncbi:MAG: CPBP family intramembrane glutamic endopeptidase [Candidatus Thorarchaeota archaeon]|jgi:membrane protease YdiL (CAAX protease family)